MWPMCHRCSNTAYMKIVHEDADMMLTMYICEDHIYIYILYGVIYLYVERFGEFGATSI